MSSTISLEIQHSPTYHPLITITPSTTQTQATPAPGRAADEAGSRVGRLPLDVTQGTASAVTQDTPLVVTKPRKRHYKPRARKCACGCGQRFKPTPQQPRQRFATDACRQRAHRAKLPKRLRQRRELGTLLCTCCGMQYIGTLGVGRLYCTGRCKRTAARVRRSAAAEALALTLNMTLEQADERVEVHGLRSTRLALVTLTTNVN